MTDNLFVSPVPQMESSFAIATVQAVHADGIQLVLTGKKSGRIRSIRF